MHNFTEKRGFPRMPMDCPVRFRIKGREQLSAAIVSNLSSSGLLIIAEEEIPPGAVLALEILPGKTTNRLSPPRPKDQIQCEGVRKFSNRLWYRTDLQTERGRGRFSLNHCAYLTYSMRADPGILSLPE